MYYSAVGKAIVIFTFVLVGTINALPYLAFGGHANALKDLRHVKYFDASIYLTYWGLLLPLKFLYYIL